MTEKTDPKPSKPTSHQEELEAEFKTGALPQVLRDSIYHLAYEEGHSYGMSEVRLEYEDYANLALDAYSAGYHAGRRDGA